MLVHPRGRLSALDAHVWTVWFTWWIFIDEDLFIDIYLLIDELLLGKVLETYLEWNLWHTWGKYFSYKPDVPRSWVIGGCLSNTKVKREIPLIFVLPNLWAAAAVAVFLILCLLLVIWFEFHISKVKGVFRFRSSSLRHRLTVHPSFTDWQYLTANPLGSSGKCVWF